MKRALVSIFNTLTVVGLVILLTAAVLAVGWYLSPPAPVEHIPRR